MSEQAVTGTIPKECGTSEHWLTRKEKNGGKYKYLGSFGKNGSGEIFVVEKDTFTRDCLNKLMLNTQTRVEETNRQAQTIIGTTAGAGGLACGLGLFPCLVKLISKIKG